MYRISSQTEKKIVELWFEGFPRDTIARKVNVSGSTVSNVVNELPDCLRELRSLSVELRKADESIPEALKGAKLLNKLHDLEVEPGQLADFIKANQKLARKEGYEPKTLVQATIKISNLEEETGKTYSAVIEDFNEKTKQNKKLEEENRILELQVKNLNKEFNQTAVELKSLNESREAAQKVLDNLENYKAYLQLYGIETNDLKTIKEFLGEIRRLGEDPRKVVEIFKKTRSIEGQLSKRVDQIKQLDQIHEQDQKDHENKVAELERTEKGLGHNISIREEKIHKLSKEESDLRERVEGLKKDRAALEQQVDGLLRKQAEMLKVQPDIDLVSEALPLRQKELKQLEQKKEEERTIIEGAEAIAALLAKQPYERDTMISFLQLTTKNKKVYEPIDEHTRQRMVDLMAKEGYVPKVLLEAVEKKAQKDISYWKNDGETWKRIAEKKLKEFNLCQEQLRQERTIKEKKLDKSIEEKASNIAVEIIKRFR